MLRIISVGGVLLALTIFVLALNPRDDLRSHWAGVDMPARGALIDRTAHPEWRQLLLMAALRRAVELQELRALPDTPVRRPPPAPAARNKAAYQVAALPLSGQAATGGPDVTAPEAATIPVDIGEASSTELPVAPHEELPPVITVPQPLEGSAPPAAPVLRKVMRQDNPDKPPASAIKPQPARPKPHESRTRPQERPHHLARHHTRTAKPASTAAEPPPFDLFALLFASFKANAEHGPPNSLITARK